MFDWNDEELANVIWGEAGESDDHIVPYPGGSEEKPPGLFGNHIKKERDQEAANVKPAERKNCGAKSDFHGSKLERNSQYDTNEGFSNTGCRMDLWPDLSLSNAAKTDHDSMGTKASNNLTEVSKYDSSRCDELARLDNGSEIYQNRHEDGEESDFVDYCWANIGSFDDLDKIFSNDDPMFGHSSLGNADEHWSSSKDVTSRREKSIHLSVDSPSSGLGALRSTSELFDTKTECMLDQDQLFTAGYENLNDFSSHAQNVQVNMEPIGYTGGKSNLLVKDKTCLDMIGMTPAFNSHLDAGTVATPNEFVEKVNRQRKLSKCRQKSEEKSEARQLQDLCGTWSPSANQFQEFDGQYALQMGQPFPSPVLGKKKRLQGPESSQYKHIPNPLLSPLYGNMGNPYSAVPVLPQFHSGEGNHQQVPSGHEVPHGNSYSLNKSSEVTVKPAIMTPQEKIEKLRRRQQMRAMLAIQKQQQKFSNKVSCIEHSISQKCSHDNQIQLLEGGKIEVDENLSTLPSPDPSSPIEQDDSNTVCMAIDNYSMEDTILCRLQDIIAKLDIQIRFCIRDSLFRLAKSAMQRQYANDTSSTNKGSRDVEVLTKEETNSYNRFARVPDMETDTNPIDRTVAHLLFHSPLEFSGNLPESPDSPLSTKLPSERKLAGLMSSSMGFWPESCTNKQTLSQQGSKILPCLLAEGDPSKTSPCLDTQRMHQMLKLGNFKPLNE